MTLLLSMLGGFLGVLLAAISLVGILKQEVYMWPLFILGLFLLPPTRDFVLAKIKISLSFKKKSIVAACLFLLFIICTINHANTTAELEKQAKAEEQLKTEQEEKLRQENVAYFKANRDALIKEAYKLYVARNYKEAVSFTSHYVAASDEELNRINSRAKTELNKIEIAQAEAKRKAEEHEAKIKKQFSPWDGSHIAFEKLIKESMHNPDSYQHVETRYSDRGDYLTVTTKFRGTNGFGGVVTNTKRAKVSMDGDVLSILD